MKISNLSFPYPVLGMGDDIMPRPNVTNVDIKKTKSQFIFDIGLEMRNNDISTLIKSGYAQYACEIECASTFYRKCFFSKSPHFHLEILKKILGGRITFQCSVVVIKTIKGYCNTNAHEDYKGLRFDLEPGDLLAFIGQFYYDADIKYDKLRSLGSFMQITEGKMENLPKFDLGADKINIKLPTEMYRQYKESILGNRQFSNVIHSSLVFNALVNGLLYYENNKHTLWARTLKYRIDNSPELEEFKDTLEQQDPEELMKLAQMLLMNPYKRLFDSLISFNSTDED
ncbi:MAG: hypothetical protein NC102_10880 [Clostridium sp.]|nr:hypothetical protein [Clostridium sp.]